MCGRFAMIEPLGVITRAFFIDDVLADIRESYNIAPGSSIPAVIHEESRRKLTVFRWGLVPRWAKEPSIGARLINARSETVTEKPSFRDAVKRRRCLIIASGFYEWKKEGKGSTPFYIYPESEKLFGLAGIFENWASPEGAELSTCSILTTGPNSLIAQIHDRMPVIIPREQGDLWMDPSSRPEEYLSMLAPYPADRMGMHPVSTEMNSPANDSQVCIRPLQEGLFPEGDAR